MDVAGGWSALPNLELAPTILALGANSERLDFTLGAGSIYDCRNSVWDCFGKNFEVI